MTTLALYRCPHCKTRTAEKDPKDQFHGPACAECGTPTKGYAVLVDKLIDGAEFDRTLDLVLRGVLPPETLIDERHARAEQDASYDEHVLEVLREFNGATKGKTFQTFAPRPDVLRWWIGYPDLKKALVRLEKKGKITVDRSAGARSVSKWTISMN